MILKINVIRSLVETKSPNGNPRLDVIADGGGQGIKGGFSEFLPDISSQEPQNVLYVGQSKAAWRLSDKATRYQTDGVYSAGLNSRELTFNSNKTLI